MRSSLMRRDPLLLAARLVVSAGIALFSILLIFLLIGLVVVLTSDRDTVLAKLELASAGSSAYGLMLAAQVLLFALFSFCLMFARNLLRIVGSVEHGDPFTSANADRLSRMGWLNLAIQGLLFLLAAIGIGLGTMKGALLAEDAINLGCVAVVLKLVLFILARVFRRGTEMRDELEGTV